MYYKSYLIRPTKTPSSLQHSPGLPTATMPISRTELEGSIRSAIPITHLEIIDQSNGCGENYAVFVVSAVSTLIICVMKRI